MRTPSMRRAEEAREATIPPTLLGGVGYAFLRDFSVGPLVVRELSGERWPAPVTVEDLSYGPVAVVHRLREADPPFRRLIVVGAVARGAEAGTVRAHRWDGSLPGTDELQARVAEAVTGVIGLENLVLVPAALGAAPGEVLVVEVEPGVEAMGEKLSPRVRAGAERAKALLRRLARTPEGEVRLPEAPLGAPTIGVNGSGAPDAGKRAGDAGRPG